MRIVLDTNVVLSALFWRGTPYQLLEAIRQRPNVQLYSSPALLAELASVLTRPSLAKRLTMVGRTPRGVLADYVAAIELVEPIEVPRVVPEDPDDDHVIATAVTAHADFIVSGDDDLLSLAAFQNIPIITAFRALRIVSEA